MASGPFAAPWSDTGRLQGDIDRLNSELHRKANEYEVSTLRSTVGSLEYSVRELSATCDVLRSELSQLQENFREALNVIQSITTVI